MRIRESVANRSRICANRVEDFRESVANLRKPTQNCCIPMQICANSFENFRESVANLREFIAYLCKCVQTHSRTFANLSRICVTSCVVLRQMPRIPYLSPGSPGRQQKSPAGRQWSPVGCQQKSPVPQLVRWRPPVASWSPGRQCGRQVARSPVENHTNQ